MASRAHQLGRDGELTVKDVNALNAVIAAGTHDPAYDLNQDASVNGTDLDIWVVDLEHTWFGDANLDGEFNSGDFVQVFQGGKFETDQDATWDLGDWTGDLRFNSGDFVKAFQGGGFERGPRQAIRAVPEPTGFLMGLVGMLGLWTVRRRPW